MLTSRPAAVDTSSLINVLASGFAELLLEQLAPERWVAENVSRESLFLRSALANTPPERIDLDPLFRSGHLRLCQAETAEEEELYVQLAAELDDGEAVSLAIAVRRGYALVTDDRKAIRLAQEFGVLDIFGTPEVVHACAGIDHRKVLEAIEVRARFSPAANHPLRSWWSKSRSSDRPTGVGRN